MQATQLANRSNTAKQKKSLYTGTTAHMEILYNNNHENIINIVTLQ